MAATEGVSFWATHLAGWNEPFGIAVSNPSTTTPAQVRVEDIGGVLSSATVLPGSTRAFSFPDDHEMVGTAVAPLAYHVVSDIPVVAVQFNPLDTDYSADSSRLLPESSLGVEHLVSCYFGTEGGPVPDQPSYVGVVAVVPGETEVTVTPSVLTRAGPSIPAITAGESYTRTLRQYDVWQLQAESDYDLTGTVVTSTNPIAAFGGNWSATVPQGILAADHLEEQLMPLGTWGTEYLAARSPRRNTADPPEVDIWRFLASEDGTVVTTDPPQAGTPAALDRGEFLELESTEDFAVSATRPIAVLQYLVGAHYGAAGWGDPAQLRLTPTEQFLPSHIGYIPVEMDFQYDYVTVVAPTGVEVRLDGTPVAQPEFSPIGSSGYSAARVPVAEGTHRIEGDAPVALYVYGYGADRSHAYPGQMALEEINVTVICDAGGPYVEPCVGPTSDVVLDGTGSSDPGGNPVTFDWVPLDLEVSFDDPALPQPTATVVGVGVFRVRLTVSDGASRKSCETTIEITPNPTAPPEVPSSSPVPLVLGRAGEDLHLSFGKLGPGTWGYSVYEGTIGSYYDHVALACEVQPVSEGPGVVGLDFVGAAGSHYYLVTATDCGGEGPSGYDSLGIERDPALNTCGW